MSNFQEHSDLTCADNADILTPVNEGFKTASIVAARHLTEHDSVKTALELKLHLPVSFMQVYFVWMCINKLRTICLLIINH